MSGVATTEPKIDPLTLNMGMMGLCGLFTAFFPLYAGIQSASAPVNPFDLTSVDFGGGVGELGVGWGVGGSIMCSPSYQIVIE